MAEEDRRNNDKEIVPGILVQYRHHHHRSGAFDRHSAGGQPPDDHEGSALELAAQFRLGADYPDLDRWFRLAVLSVSYGTRQLRK
jgi:hypothetical protein